VSIDQIKAATIFARSDFVNADGYGKRFIVRADELLTAFLELEATISRNQGTPYTKIRQRLTRHARPVFCKNSPSDTDLNQAEGFPRWVLPPFQTRNHPQSIQRGRKVEL
jgi:hypothetical protein